MTCWLESTVRVWNADPTPSSGRQNANSVVSARISAAIHLADPEPVFVSHLRCRRRFMEQRQRSCQLAHWSSRVLIWGLPRHLEVPEGGNKECSSYSAKARCPVEGSDTGSPCVVRLLRPASAWPPAAPDGPGCRRHPRDSRRSRPSPDLGTAFCGSHPRFSASQRFPQPSCGSAG